jgi:hypothetical protein
MKLASLTATNQQLIKVRHIKNIFIVLLLTSVITLISCHSENKNSDNNKNSSLGNTSNPDSNQVNNKFGYIEQSKIISNGEDYGVKVLAVRRTANGYMLDFRFRLLDSKKSAHIMQRKIKAHLTVEKNNAKLSVPMTYKLGSLRQSGKNLKEDKNYFMLFANPGGIVKSGDLITIEIAGFKAEHITVN